MVSRTNNSGIGDGHKGKQSDGLKFNPKFLLISDPHLQTRTQSGSSFVLPFDNTGNERHWEPPQVSGPSHFENVDETVTEADGGFENDNENFKYLEHFDNFSIP